MVWVRQPEAVVRVLGVVAAEERRLVVGAEDPGNRGVGVVVPRARGLRPVEHRQARHRLIHRKPERTVHAARHLRVRHVRDRPDVGVVGVAAAVGGDRVHPRDPLELALDLVEALDALGAVDVEEVVEVAEVRGVRVAHRVGGRRRPREQRQTEDRREDRPLQRRVEGARLRLQRAVRLPHHHGHLVGPHLVRHAVVEVSGGGARHELQLERGEAERR